jgi:hypothetical protein
MIIEEIFRHINVLLIYFFSVFAMKHSDLTGEPVLDNNGFKTVLMMISIP